MNPRKKKKRNGWINSLIFVIILILVLLLGYFQFSQSFFGTQDLKIRTYEDETILPTSKGTFSLDGYAGNYESTFLGSAVSNGNPGGYYIDGDSDSDISVSNSFSDGDELRINTFLRNLDNNHENKNEFTVTLPAGVLRIDCQAEISGRNAFGNYFTCGVLGKEKVVIAGPEQRDGSNSFSESFEVVLNREQEVTIYTIESTDKGSISATLTANFIKDVTEEGGEVIIIEETPGEEVISEGEGVVQVVQENKQLIYPISFGIVLLVVLITVIVIRRKK